MITTGDLPLVPAVVLTLPAGLAGSSVQVSVQHLPWGVEVDIRPTGNGTWTPLSMLGGSFEIRP